MIYVPAGIWLGFTTGWLPALTMVGLISVVQFLIDNILRPKLVSTASEIHPALVILGALGGIVLMGLVGFLVGPLILSFFFTLLNEHRTT